MGKFPQSWVLLSDACVPEYFGKKNHCFSFKKKGKLLEKQIVRIISIIISERQAVFFL